MIEAGSDLESKNLAEKTPEGVIDSELEVYKAYVPSDERDFTIERLNMVKTLF